MVQKKEIKVTDIKGIGTKTFLEWLDDDNFLGMLVDAGVIEK